MSERCLWRCPRALLVAAVLLLGLLPLGTATADTHRTSTRTEISFALTSVEVVTAGDESLDEAGVTRIRGEVLRADVSGDISGEATITFNSDLNPGPECDPNNLENCLWGEFSAWGAVIISDETGAWEGDFLFAESFFGGEESFTFGELILAGRGAYSGKSIVTDVTFSEVPEENGAVFTGLMLSMGLPAFSADITTELCFSESPFAIVGAFTASRGIETDGEATARLVSGGVESTHRYGLFGEVIFTDESGSFTVQFLGESQDHPESSTAWGHWVIVGGTDAYAELYGRGKVTGAAMENMQCASGFGARLQFLGDLHVN